MKPHSILFVHYRIGDRDGVNAVIFRNITSFQEMNPDWPITLAGKISENFNEFEESYEQEFKYIDIPEFCPSSCPKPISDYSVFEYVDIGKNILAIMKRRFHPFDVIIIENLQVGNFPPMVYAVNEYARWCLEHAPKKKLILRAHDFFSQRPENFKNVVKFNRGFDHSIPDWHPLFFMNLPNIYYIAINIKSMNFLYEHGIPEEKLFFLPNSLDDMIHKPDEKTPQFRELLNEKWGLDPEEEIIFSPIRCAPRKNVGESLLLIKVLNKLASGLPGIPENLRHKLKFHFVLSMSVEEGKAASYSKGIEQLAQDCDIPAHIGFKGLINLERIYNDDGSIKQFSLSDAYGISRACLTTSTLEGFGFVFLEPWRTDCVLIGRDLRDVTYDFTGEANMNFDHLYKKLTIDGEDFHAIGSSFTYLHKGGNLISERRLGVQTEIIKSLDDDAFFLSFIEENKRALAKIVRILINPYNNKELIEFNKAKVEEVYTPRANAKRFNKIFETILGS